MRGSFTRAGAERRAGLKARPYVRRRSKRNGRGEPRPTNDAACLDAEGAAAAAGAFYVGVVEFEAGAFYGFYVVDLDAVQVHFGHLIYHYFQAAELVDVVVVFVGGAFEGHVVADPGSASAYYGYAQARGDRVLLRENFLHFLNRDGG